MEGIPKDSEHWTESVEKVYMVPFINDDYKYDETLDPKIALEKYFDWVIITSGENKGEYYLEPKEEIVG